MIRARSGMRSSGRHRLGGGPVLSACRRNFFGSPTCFPGTWLGSWSHLPFFLCTPLLRSWNDDLRFCIWAPRWRRPNPRACPNTKSKAHLMYPSLRSEVHPCLGAVDRRIQSSKRIAGGSTSGLNILNRKPGPENPNPINIAGPAYSKN